MKTKNLLAIAATIFMTFSAVSLYAQTSPPPPPGSGAPVDGGVITLVIGAAILGYKNLRTRANS